MQIKFGEIIRELRRRDGRKQEDLAVALGVTNQAVSRWESGGGYPDVELIPAIANYFHITIDRLFGYDSDRESRLQTYRNRADRMLSADAGPSEVADCVAMLRDALSEFPAEWTLQFRLARALTDLGCQKRDAKEGDCDGRAEIREAAELYEAILKTVTDADVRENVIWLLFLLYCDLGQTEDAERLANSQPQVRISREVLLANLPAGKAEKKEENQGNAILILLHQLADVIGNASTPDLPAAEYLAILRAVAGLYGSILSDGNDWMLHSDVCMIHLRCAVAAAKSGDPDAARAHFDTAMGHYRAFCGIWGQETPDFPYTAPLVRRAGGGRIPVVLLEQNILDLCLKSLPESLADAIRSDPRYADVLG